MMLIVLLACKGGTEKKDMDHKERQMYTEAYRPQFHFSPAHKWMNDPNGLVYHEGVYHLFYQFYPDDIVWGPMHWAHAVSKDMVHWEHKPIALYPDDKGYIFSGSAVVDKQNTSGFGVDGKIPLAAIFTYHDPEGEEAGRDDFQTQGIAYSLDNGDSWTKFSGNPVIGNDGIKDFRDPKVFWHEESHHWIMILVAGDHAKWYRSNNLKDWEHLSDFGKNSGAHGGVWECPDLFPLQVEGTDTEKWVLLISINPGAPNGGSGTQYFVGEFDGVRFVSDQEETKWVDYGTDNYAGVTYNNVPDEERIFIGWMSNWDYARDTPTEQWRGAMTLPRKLSLHQVGEDYLLANYPLESVENLAVSNGSQQLEVAPASTETVEWKSFDQSQVAFTTKSRDFSIRFQNDLDEELVLTMSSQDNTFYLDRKNSGKVDFQTEFGNKKQHMPINGLEGEFEVKILMDTSSIEVFIADGLYAMTAQIFPTESFNRMSITNGDNTEGITAGSIKKVASIWSNY